MDARRRSCDTQIGASFLQSGFPVSPYVGNIENAPVVILNANAGYDEQLTPTEFPNEAAIRAYVKRVDHPAGSDWSFVSAYYDATNYGQLVANGRAALINACAYRSKKITEEKENQRLIRRLPSCIFARRWLLEALLPAANQGERLIVVNRGGQWRLPKVVHTDPGVVVDRAPISPLITGEALRRMTEFLT